MSYGRTSKEDPIDLIRERVNAAGTTIQETFETVKNIAPEVE